MGGGELGYRGGGVLGRGGVQVHIFWGMEGVGILWYRRVEIINIYPGV